MELVRVAFALIPCNPLFDAVIRASQGITDEFYYNANVIDSTTFPPHLSLHICTVPRPALGEVTSALEQLAADALPEITPAGVEPAGGGYVMLNIERSPALMALHEAILDVAARAEKAWMLTHSAAGTYAARSSRTSRWPSSTATISLKQSPSADGHWPAA